MTTPPNNPFDGYGNRDADKYEQSQPGYGYGMGYPKDSNDYEQASYSAIAATDGKLDIMLAIKYGIQATFKRPLLWIGGAALFMLVIASISAFTALISDDSFESSNSFAEVIFNIVLTIATFLINPFLYRAFLLAMDLKEINFTSVREGFSYKSSLLIQIISSLITGILLSLGFVFILISVVAGTDYGEPNWAMFILGCIVLLGITIIITPLISYWLYYVVDGQSGLVDVMKQAVEDGKRNFFQIIGFCILFNIGALLFILVTLTLGTVVALPVYLHAQTSVYRQISGRGHAVVGSSQ
ncbi:hypothetical protein UL82_06110 [Corynebacterium kutscheri]|uniref:Uncharacterized protein n=1 Tax=Corynebacterium kutscheri TaxID=35755 RepID=A0A0F6R245_9CORY|nr:hypothetical protein [Corynebacterium kutscheri]AKE41388.1 hypothetical protein UL82_06110 [Corynebacterium kutscheri]VEH09712.1 hypothetical membrane protein [Corynebacterium kutscheri]